MVDRRSDREFYREYLRDHPEREPSSFTRALTAAGLAAGGYFAYKKGLLRPLMKNAIQMLGNYRKTKLSAMTEGLRNWSNEKFSQGATLTHKLERLSDHMSAAMRSHERKVAKAQNEILSTSSQSTLMTLIRQKAKVMNKLDEQWEMMTDAEKAIYYPNKRIEGGVVGENIAKENWKSQIEKKFDESIANKNNFIENEQAQKVKETGFRHAKVSEILQIKELDAEEKGFIQRAINQFKGKMDIESKIYDDNVFFNPDTKEIMDLRDFMEDFSSTMDTLSDEFAIPFVKINPLRMFYLNRFSKENRPPSYALLEKGIINPIVTGNIEPTKTAQLFIDGNVFSLSDLEKPIVDNVRLVPGQSGPIARYIRNLAGISVSRYEKPNDFWGKIKWEAGKLLDLGFQDEPIGRDISWNFGQGIEGPSIDPTTWPSYLGRVLHRVFRPYDVKNSYKMPLEQSFGGNTPWIVMRNYKGLKDYEKATDYFKQFTAGRDNLENVTTGTLFPYGFFERLNSTLNQVGFGLSNQNLGSASQIFLNLVFRRVAPIFGAVEVWDYLNTESDRFLGFQFEDKLANFYVSGAVGVAKVRDALGITDWAKHYGNLFPGGDQITGFPLVGQFFDLDDTAEETRKFYEDGEVAVRKGRFWEFGNTPFTGSKIEYFKPNWVRETIADVKFSDTLYGSREEYFANTWYPTPTNPFAPIRHFITDPYHYEKKHYYDRPYMITGGFSEIEEFPLIGPILNNVASFFLKPPQRMHEKYWDLLSSGSGVYAPTLNNELYPMDFYTGDSEKYTDEEANFAAGRPLDMEMPLFVDETIQSDKPVITSEASILSDSIQFNRIGETPSNQSYAAYVTSSGNIETAIVNRAQLRSLNERIKERGLAGAPGSSMFAYEEPGMSIDNRYVMSPTELTQLAGNLYSNITEMGGFYGFTTQSIFGQFGSQPVIADSTDMTSMQRAFWNLSIGNLGGDVNEIFRRFVPKPLRQDEYNPIPNTMPSWLPGPEYFMDFQHGDPYSKITKGESRLPGEGYERLYNVEVDNDMSIGASFLGYEIPVMINHMLRKDEIKDEDEAYILDKGSDWHKKWERQMQSQNIALDYEQYVSIPDLGVGGFYDVKAAHAKFLEKAMQDAEVFKYYSSAGDMTGAKEYGGFYNSSVDLKALQQQNPEAFRGFIQKSLDDAAMVILDPKTMTSNKYNQDEMFFKNVQQVNFYLKATGLSRGYLIHVNRDDIESGMYQEEPFKVYAFDFNQQLFDYSIGKVNTARQAINEGMKTGMFGPADFYGMLDRFRILADVAPYSDEYRQMKKDIRRWQYITPEQLEEVREIEDQVSQKKEAQRLYPYRFKTADIQKITATVEDVIDYPNQRTFMFKIEGVPNPIKLAGVTIPMGKDDPKARKARQIIGIKPGDTVTLGVDTDELNQINDDTYRTISAVLYNNDININKQLIESGVAKEREEDYSPASVYARFTKPEIMIGRLWESIAHLDTPYNTKFMQVRSALESYEIRETYNKNWQEWTDPFGDFFIPWFQNIMRKEPAVAIATGALLGYNFGNKRYGKIVGALGGATIGLIGSIYTNIYEGTTGDRWIPDRRLKEREMFEYLDILKYVKFRRLYEDAAIQAEEDGFNVKKYIQDKQNEGEINKRIKSKLQRLKRQIRLGNEDEVEAALNEASDMGIEGNLEEVIYEINQRLNSILNDRQIKTIPQSAALALQYYQEAEQTMYAYDPGEPLENFLAAVPKKDRAYILPFLEAPEEERGRILQTVPSYIRRMLQASYGMPVDEKPDLVEYFSTHELPEDEWVGWDSRASLKDLKVKLVKEEKLDESEFDIWPDDKAVAAKVAMEAPNINKMSNPSDIRSRLEDMLKGIGLTDIDITVSPVNGQGSVNAVIKKDRRNEIAAQMNQDAHRILG